MTNEFKKINQGNITRYVLENASGGGTSSGSVASVSMPMGGMQRRKGDNLIAQESDKKKVPATTPRNFVAKNAKSSGAGAHKDKKKAAKQGQEKHKKPFMEDHSTASGGWGQGSYDTYSGGNHGRGVAENPEWYSDEANGMSSSQLKSLYKHAMKLRQAVQQMQAQGDTLEPWQQSKVTKAADYLDAVFNAVDDEHDMGESNHPDEKEDKALIRKMVKQQALKQERLTKEGDAGLSKDAETNFHAKLDQLVHATFGKRKEEQGMEEDDSALNAFLSKGGKVQQLPYKKPRKADKTDYGSKHIGGGGDKMKASRTGTAAKTQGSKVVGVSEGWDDIKKFGKKAAVAGAIGLGISAANAGGWTPTDVPAGGHNQLPDIVAHVKFKVGDKEVSKEINLGSHYRSPGEAGKELENFLKSKGIKFYEYSLERVKPKANDKIDSSPATSGMDGSMDTKEPAATGPSTDNYMAKDNDPERGPSMGSKFVREKQGVAEGDASKAQAGQDLGNGFVLTTVDVFGRKFKVVLDTQSDIHYLPNRNESGGAIVRSMAPFITIKNGQANTTMSVGPATQAAMKKAGLLKGVEESVAEDFSKELRDKLDREMLRISNPEKYQHQQQINQQDREHELNIGSQGRAELKQKADELAEIKREKLRQERLEDEELANQRYTKRAEREQEMEKIRLQYNHELKLINTEHGNNMEAIKTGNSHELTKMDKEYAEADRERRHAAGESDKDRAERAREREAERREREDERQANRQEPIKTPPLPTPANIPSNGLGGQATVKDEPEDEPEDDYYDIPPGANFDPNTGKPLKPQNSQQWHTNQQLQYNKPSKPSKYNNDDAIDVDAKPVPNQPLKLKEKLSVVRDPAHATGIQQTGGITHGSVYIPGKGWQTRQTPVLKHEIAVDAKGRTQKQWIQLVKAKYPSARVIASKMINGPVQALLPNGKTIHWEKAEQNIAESNTTYFESLNVMLERQLEPTMDLDAWVDNFQNANPNKYHQFKNKTPEKKK